MGKDGIGMNKKILTPPKKPGIPRVGAQRVANKIAKRTASSMKGGGLLSQPLVANRKTGKIDVAATATARKRAKNIQPRTTSIKTK